MDRIRKIFKQLLNPSEEICGLDIGSNTIKALLTERDKQGIRLTRFASCPTPPASIVIMMKMFQGKYVKPLTN